MPKRPWIERYGPAVACLLLIVLTTWAAWQSLTAPAPREAPPVVNVTQAADANAGKPDATAPAPGAPTPAAGQADMAAAGTTPVGEGAAANPDAAKKADGSTRTPRPETRLFPGSVATAEKPDGVFLRSSEQKPEWERILAETPLKAGDRVLCLTPFRAAIDLEKLRIELVGETEVRLLPRDDGSPPAFELVQGRIVIRRPDSGTFRVVLSKQTIDVGATSDGVFGMERVNRNAYGQPIRQLQPLGVLCQQGEITLKIGDKSQTLKPMYGALISAGGQLESGKGDALPAWLTQAEPSPAELQLKEEFLKVFHADRPLLTEVVGALDDDRPEIKGLAVEALCAMGDLTYLMPTLTRANRPRGPAGDHRRDPRFHDAGAHGLGACSRGARPPVRRGAWRRGPSHADRVHCRGVGAPEVQTRLVGLLSPDREDGGIVGIRELAVETLSRLTGRDTLGYNPDKPEGKGYDAWNDLLRRNELRPLATRPAAGKTKAAR